MQSIQLLSDSNYIRLVALDLNSKDIISEQVCLREYQIFGAKTLIVGLFGGAGRVDRQWRPVICRLQACVHIY